MADSFLRLIATLVLLACAVQAVGLATEDESSKRVGAAIAGLDSDDYEVREQSMRKLVELGKPAMPEVIRAAKEGSAEATWRAVEVLNEFALSMDPAVVDMAEGALTTLAAMDHPSTSARAKETLEQLSQSRHDRAVAMIAGLGGKFDYARLTLDANWKGGLDGLKFVKRVLDLRQINIEPAAGLSDDEVDKLETMLKSVEAERKIKITRFGTAFLGIGGGIAEGTNGVTVVTVVPGGPAAGAGLEINDLITQLDGVKTTNFDQLIAYVRTKAVGDKIKITFYRDGEKRTGDAVLQARPGSKEIEKLPK